MKRAWAYRNPHFDLDHIYCAGFYEILDGSFRQEFPLQHISWLQSSRGRGRLILDHLAYTLS
jgi:hypothetical protein